MFEVYSVNTGKSVGVYAAEMSAIGYAVFLTAKYGGPFFVRAV